VVHDAMYQFITDGLPITHCDTDQCFLFLIQKTDFRPHLSYYLIVRLFGGLVWRIKRSFRKTKGTVVQFPF
jgi:hypothetical protein